MLEHLNFLIGTAMAQTADPTGAPAATSGSVLMQFAPLFLIFGVFYFLLIRPQQKKYETANAMMKALKKGDKIITSGGIIGTITKLDGDDNLIVEIAEGVQVKVVRSTITGLVEDKAAKDVAKTDDKKN